MHGRALLLMATLTVALLGCPGSLENPDRFLDGGGGTTDGGGMVCNIDIEATTWKTSCGGAGCHEAVGAAAASQNLDLVAPGVKARIGAQTSSCSGKSMAAYILEKVKPAQASCPGSVMPLGKPALTAMEILCVEEWVKSITDGGT